ncbi:hypothetical protein [Listeria booriae]|uniref:Uncharacterized protein n=1 Tax=Listeria booriae TaxID=1552123 RepID=A0A099W8C8_9LIST|nr:hypothetical protein [Listeria booriae]KGL40365.1 hypothetical protein EP57_10730 [Listeria booriae]MBC1210166.1 hypothetical protein [Listeria booriae]MBC1225769.1 hypothetical protein [Listeria booriae]MBC1229423.1 hypothetical protein [Listeria booriae]MBC1232444.1 hypothetical protein [Listeria booriae]
MNKTGKVESFYFPTKDGMLKLHVYGFNPVGSWGEVYTTLNEQTVCVKGFHRQKTIMRSVKMMLDSNVNKKQG